MPDTTKPFSCAVVPRRQAVHVCPAGELDLSTEPEVDARLAELHLAGFDDIVLDLSGVTFFDSSGAHLVMRWTRRSGDERFAFAVIAGSDVVERVLELTGVKPHLRDGSRARRPPPRPGQPRDRADLGGRPTDDPPTEHQSDVPPTPH